MKTSVGEVVYRFEGFTLDQTRGILLSRSGEEVRLRHKSFELLRLFVENAKIAAEVGQDQSGDLVRCRQSPTTVSPNASTIFGRAFGDEVAGGYLKTVPQTWLHFAVKVTSHHDDRG